MARYSQHIEICEPDHATDERARGVGSSAGGSGGVAMSLIEGVTAGLIAEAQDNRRILAVLEDVSFPGIEWWVKNAPDRVVEVGIAEQNGAVVAAAYASEGFIPVVYNLLFACVARAYNQIRQSILVDRFNVKFIAREGAWGEWGVSHNTVEGVGILRVLPNLVILNPADTTEARKATQAMLRYHGPVVLRLEASPTPMRVFTEGYPFQIGRAYTVKEGDDATIIATGYMLTEAVRASNYLDEEGLSVGVLNMCTLKPLDDEAIIAAAVKTGAIVTAENASIIGGLGDGVAAVLAGTLPTPVVKVGVDDEFSQSGLFVGDKDELKEHFRLDAIDVVEAVRQAIALKSKTHHQAYHTT